MAARRREIFQYSDYKRYLNDYIRGLPAHGHGFRSRMAEKAGCRVAFISQVLNGHLHLSLEQSEAMNELLEHTTEESDFFLLLTQYTKAGSAKLRERLGAQMERARQKRLVLKDRVDIKTSLDPAAQATYYSSWHYAAIHILVTIQKFQTREAIADHLALPPRKVGEVLEFLQSAGLVQSNGGRLTAGLNRLCLGSDSPMIARHHTNWRMRAIDSLDHDPASDVHISTLLSFSEKDLLKLKEQVVNSIEGTRGIARVSSPEEVLYCFCVDFFKV
jgi:uncharacterized protein (TIGR02147 family)